MTDLVTCPTCHGKRTRVLFVCGRNAGGMRETACSTCEGAGKISTDYAAKIAFGKKVRDHRVHVREETGSEVAERIGVDRIAYNHFEHGMDVPTWVLRAILAEVGTWGIDGANPYEARE